MIQLAGLSRSGDAVESDDGRLDPAIMTLRELAEFPKAGDTVYVLERDGAGELVARPLEVDEERRFLFPFVKPSGSQSAQIGPIIKRSFSKKNGIGPSEKILKTTLKSFAKKAKDPSHGPLFRRTLEILGEQQPVESLRIKLSEIDAKGTVFVSLGPPVGGEPSYASHLLETLRSDRYGLSSTSPRQRCPLCGELALVSDKGLKGAGINFVNRDRVGAFPGVTDNNAVLRFAICGECADSLRIFKQSWAKELKCYIAGQPAVIIPHVHVGETTSRMQRLLHDVLDQAGRDVAATEDRLLRALARAEQLVAFHVLWATVGQDLDDVRGFLTDVPNTRLRELSRLNKDANRWMDPAVAQVEPSVFPRRPLRELDLSLSLLEQVLKHPGGKKAKSRNQGERRAALLRELARAVYTGNRLDERGLWREIQSISQGYLTEASSESKRAASLWKEAKPRKKKQEMWLTAAGWVRHVAFCLYYLRTLEVLEMSEETYRPGSALLVPYFDGRSGIDSEDKAFAFLLGLLFGKLMKTQAARKVNVQSNALSWLRRGTLAGRDLPELYAKVRQKLLEYNVEASPEVREVVTDLSRLGSTLGEKIELSGPQTMYFLLLGQALVDDILPSKSGAPDDGDAQEDMK